MSIIFNKGLFFVKMIGSEKFLLCLEYVVISQLSDSCNSKSEDKQFELSSIFATVDDYYDFN